MKVKNLFVVLTVVSICFLTLAGPLGPGAVFAEEAWKAEFEAICSQSNDSMSFSEDKLKELLGRCDKLKPVIEGLEASPRKVYLKRLQLCRDLYAFVLESKKTSKEEAVKSPEKK